MPSPDKRYLDAVKAFQDSPTVGTLWDNLNHHLRTFGITGSIFGTEAFPDINKKIGFLTYNSIGNDWLHTKIDKNLFYNDEYVQAARTETAPILWSDTTRLETISLESLHSLAIDYDFGITTGVTIPMHFANGISSIGCHAANMDFAEFDQIWLENNQTILGIVQAFDVYLRSDHIGEIFPLSPRERECLLWLASGLKPEQIAYRLGTHYKTVDKQIRSACRKLKTTNKTQAIATALVFGVITP